MSSKETLKQKIQDAKRPELVEAYRLVYGANTWGHRAKKEDLQNALAELVEDSEDAAELDEALEEAFWSSEDDSQDAEGKDSDSEQDAEGEQEQEQENKQDAESEQQESEQEQQQNEPDHFSQAVVDALKARKTDAREALEVDSSNGAGEVDEDAVRMIAAEVLNELQPPRQIEIKTENKPPKKITGEHERFGDMMFLAGQCKQNVFLVGPAGSGKTTAAERAAKSLDLPFVVLSMGPQTTQSDIFGFVNAHGNTVRTNFREVYENGGWIILDEADRMNERIAPTLNAAIEQGYCAFPDGMVQRHADTVFVATGNTQGHGADRQYNSARQQDAAFLNRWAVIPWDYDLALEERLTLSVLEGKRGEAWLALVRRVRIKVEEFNLRYVVSPRQAIRGASVLANGGSKSLALETVLYGGWSDEDRKRVESALNSDSKKGGE